jgi:hypothetical protein
MPNPFETSPELIPTKEKVTEIILKHAESVEFEILRDLSDESGLTVLDLRFQGKEPGVVVEYLYTRAGKLPNGDTTSSTSIEVSYYKNGKIYWGERVAIYNPETNTWDSVE